MYIWPENSPVYNVFDIDFFSLLQTDINESQSQGMVTLCCDFNSRIGARSDFIPCDRNVQFCDDGICLPDIPVPCDSVENVCIAYGQKFVDICKSVALRIANGMLQNSDSVSYTFASHVGSSVIDHAPLTFSIACNNVPSHTDVSDNGRTRVKWNRDLRNALRKCLISKLPEMLRIRCFVKILLLAVNATRLSIKVYYAVMRIGLTMNVVPLNSCMIMSCVLLTISKVRKIGQSYVCKSPATNL